MANPLGSAARNSSIMAQGRPDASRTVATVRGTAVPTVSTVDPKAEAFGAWILQAHPELSGLGGGAKRSRMMPQLMQEFEPVWLALQKKLMPAPVAPDAGGSLGTILAGQ